MVSVPTAAIVYPVPRTNGPGSPAMVNPLITSVPPSTSLALASSPAAALTVRVVSSVTLAVSSPSTGASLRPWMVMVRTAVSASAPSESV